MHNSTLTCETETKTEKFDRSHCAEGDDAHAAVQVLVGCVRASVRPRVCVCVCVCVCNDV